MISLVVDGHSVTLASAGLEGDGYVDMTVTVTTLSGQELARRGTVRKTPKKSFLGFYKVPPSNLVDGHWHDTAHDAARAVASWIIREYGEERGS